jgi:hypothetical protein
LCVKVEDSVIGVVFDVGDMDLCVC